MDNHIPLPEHQRGDRRSKPYVRHWLTAINAAGGDATQINLADIGIPGNSHMMYFEKNSDDIAKVVADWIKKHVKK